MFWDNTYRFTNELRRRWIRAIRWRNCLSLRWLFGSLSHDGCGIFR